MRRITALILLLLGALLIFLLAEWAGLIPASMSWPETWLLRGLVLLLLVGILVAGGRIRSITLHQHDLLEKQVAERTEELRVANQKLQKENRLRKTAEEALARRTAEQLSVAEARFQSMFDAAAIGIGIMGLDHRIIDANPAICRMFGRSREELIGMLAAEATYPEDMHRSNELHNVLANGEQDSYEVDRRYIRKNGEVFWAHVTMSTVRGLDGRPRFLVGMVDDIEEQKRAEEELRRSEARFRAVFDSASVGVALMGLDRRIQAVNKSAQRITGYTEQELKSVPSTDFSYVEDRMLDRQLFQELVDGQRQQYVIEKRYVHKNGTIFWGRVNFSAVRDPEGTLQYLIGLIEDITEEKLAANKLAAQEDEYRRTLEQRVDERTHELQQINDRLQQEIAHRQKAEQALAEKAAQEAVAGERARLARDLHDAVTQTLFSASLIAEVLPELWASDAEEGRQSTEELRQLTRGALAEMRTLLLELRPAALTQSRFEDLLKQLSEALIGRTRLPVRLSIEGERKLPPEVQIALYRIAQESLNNIVKYARATQVSIDLILSRTGLHMEIRDDGSGFDPTKIKPTSLGMRIMRERAQTIGADFEVMSQPGKGTTVSITWNHEDGPVAEPDEPQAAKEIV
jgi:PAS domain S-box-containing protein